MFLIQESIYKVSIEFGSCQTATIDDESRLYMIIFGSDGHTEKMPLMINKNGEIEFKGNDVGKVRLFSIIINKFIRMFHSNTN